MANVSIPEIIALQISLPCLEEQEKIAVYLSTIDEKISNTQLALEQIKSFKKAMLQKMMGD